MIEKPIVTEKGVSMSGMDRYAFKVNKNASKGSVAEAINNMFSVDVIEVKTQIVPGKRKRIRGKREFTKTKGWKKATVRIKAGQKIDMFTSLIGGDKK